MDGCNHYRFRIPYEMIRKRVDGAYLDWAPISKVREWAMDPRASIRPADYDMFILARHRPLPYIDDAEIEGIPDSLWESISKAGIELERESHLLDLVRVLKAKQCVVAEYDDDYWTGSRDLGHKYPELTRKLLSEVDAVTVSTPHLRKITQRYAAGTPVYILPNSVMFSEWQGHERWDFWEEDAVVLGLTGSITHGKDWEVLEDVLPRVLKENGNVALLLSGFVPDYLKPLLDKYPGRVFAQDHFVDYMKYPAIVRQADITLCPVDPEDPFNWAKSGIKAIEGMAAGRLLSNGKTGGAAVIASPLDYYKRVVGSRNKRGIIVEHTPESWYQAITLLVKDRGRRERYGKKGRAWVYTNRAAENTWPLWWNAYQEIYRRKR
jgi:glycosyltransferase involved in cell wall biosynthesis